MIHSSFSDEFVKRLTGPDNKEELRILNQQDPEDIAKLLLDQRIPEGSAVMAILRGLKELNEKLAREVLRNMDVEDIVSI